MAHYYSEKQISKLKLRKIKARLRDFDFEFYTGSGIFSPKRIDRGTALLIKHMKIKNDDVALDLGCGYGAIGLTAAKITKNKVYLTDINERACKLANTNKKLNSINNAEIIQGNLYESTKGKKFDTILINPPQAAGKRVCFSMIEGAKKHLKKDGLLHLVARHRKGGKTLSEKMESVFGNVETIVKKGGFRVYVSKNY